MFRVQGPKCTRAPARKKKKKKEEKKKKEKKKKKKKKLNEKSVPKSTVFPGEGGEGQI